MLYDCKVNVGLRYYLDNTFRREEKWLCSHVPNSFCLVSLGVGLISLVSSSSNTFLIISVSLGLQQMLAAVRTIHDERIVHSDLKPANFMLVRGELKLIDFGIAKAIQNDTTNIVKENQVRFRLNPSLSGTSHSLAIA